MISHFRQRQRYSHGGKSLFLYSMQEAFSFPIKLTEHQRIHSEEKPFHCVDCAQEQLKSHLGIYIQASSYVCDECGKVFASKRNLQHQRIHTGKKPYEYSKYKKPFRASSQLGHDEHVHSGEKLMLDVCHSGLPEHFTLSFW